MKNRFDKLINLQILLFSYFKCRNEVSRIVGMQLTFPPIKTLFVIYCFITCASYDYESYLLASFTIYFFLLFSISERSRFIETYLNQ